MFKNRKRLISAILCALMVSVVFAAQSPNAATTALLQRADDAYTNADYKKAFGYVNAALKMNETDYKANGVASNVALLARQTYRKLLQQVATSKDFFWMTYSGRLRNFPILPMRT